jgi:hypothetical protein
MYQRLDPTKIVETAVSLERRISERFSESGLSRVASEVTEVARQAGQLSDWLQKPNLWLRGGVVASVVLIVALVFGAFLALDLNVSLFTSISDFMQGLESAINDFIFLGLAIYFLGSGETRLKRRRALEALHVLRSMAHIIDMHQLTKDPEQFMTERVLTPSSPKRDLTPYQLTRYLDYCSELLAILSKIAAVYVQQFTDPATLSAVNDVEELTNGLSRKIWQKIMILNRVARAQGDRRIVTPGFPERVS